MKLARHSTARLCITAGAMLLLAGTHAVAAGPDEVIAESARAKVTVADYEAEIDKLPPAARLEFAANKLRLTQFMDTLYTSRVLAADARASGLDKDPLLARQIAIQVDRLLAAARYAQLEAAAMAQFDKSLDLYTARAREIYLSMRTKYAVPEQVRASHILVRIKDGDAEAARKRAEEARTKALAGADFALLAAEYSDDPSVARNGGELGFFDMKSMNADFAAAAFAMTKKGELSPPVKSALGYHIIRFEDRRAPTVKSFDEVKAEILEDLRKRAKDDARAAAVRDVFSDPTLKVNNALIDQLNVEGVKAADSLRSQLPKP